LGITVSDSAHWKGKVVLAAITWLILLAIGAVAWKLVIAPKREQRDQEQARLKEKDAKAKADQTLAAT
jgi:hypothetical protein